MAETRTIMAAALLIAAALTATACDRPVEKQAPKHTFGQQELLLGLIPEQNIFRQRERYQVLGAYLSKKLGITVTFTSLSRYGNIIEHFSSEKMDGAFFGSFTYCLARKQAGVEVLVRPVNPDGTSTYYGYIFVRRNSGIRDLAGMKGKRFAFVEQATTAGYLFPIAYFRDHGIADPRSYLGEVFFTGSHDAAVQAVLSGEADIGAAKNTVYDRLAQEEPRIGKDLTILAASGSVPQNGLAVRKDLDPELKSAVAKALLEMDRDPEGIVALKKFGARGFVATTDSDYAYVYALAQRVGIDLKVYTYRNR